MSKSIRTFGWGLAALLLITPAVAMAFTREVNWGLEDFIAAALLMAGAGLGLEVAARLPARRQLLAGAGVIGIMLLIWAELAVGILH